MPKGRKIHIKCTDHTYGTCASCGYIAASPWSEYLREIPFEEQLEIIEMEGSPLGRVLAAPEGTPAYLGALMTNAEVYPPDILVSDSVPENSMTRSVEPSETKQELSFVSVSYKRKHVKPTKKPDTKKPDAKKSSRKDLRSRKKKSWKKAHCGKMSVSIDDFLIPETVTKPIKILNKCYCHNYFLSLHHESECSHCRQDRWRQEIERHEIERQEEEDREYEEYLIEQRNEDIIEAMKEARR
jgi:hypothetical protein